MPSSRSIEAGKAHVELRMRNRIDAGLTDAERRLSRFGAAVNRTAKGLAKLTALSAAPLIGGVKVYADFEEQLAQVSVMLGDNTALLGRYREGIRRLSIEYGQGTDVLARGLYDILSAGIAAERGLDVLEVASRAAVAGLTDTATAVDAITTVLNAYGLEADQAGRVSDVLFGIVERGKTTFPELAANIGKVATTAAAVGIPMEELGATIATLTRRGIRTPAAMSAITATIGAFIKPGQEAAVVADRYGLELSRTSLAALGLEGALKKLSAISDNDLPSVVPNVEALRGILPALADLGAFGDDIRAIAESAGATDAAFEKLSSTAAFTFRQLRQAGVQVLSLIGEALAGDVKGLTRDVLATTRAVIEWVKENRGAIVTVATLTAGMGALVAILLTVGVTFGSLAVGAKGLAVAMTVLTGATGGLGVAVNFLARNPMVALGAAVGLLVLKMGGLSAAMDFVGSRARRLLPDFSALGRASAETAAAVEAERVAVEGKVSRLDELRRKLGATTAEQREAKRIAEELAVAYPALSDAIAGIGRSAEGTAKAVEAMNRAFEARRIAALKGELSELRAESKRVGAELDDLESDAARIPDLEARAAEGRVARTSRFLGGLVTAPFRAAGGDRLVAEGGEAIGLFNSAEQRVRKLDRLFQSAASAREELARARASEAAIDGRVDRVIAIQDEIRALEELIASLEESQRAAAAVVKVRPTSGGLGGFFRGITEGIRTTAEQTRRVLRDGADFYGDANRGLLDTLARLRAEAIVDPLRRRERLINLDFDRRSRDLEPEQDPALLERARLQAIENVRAEFRRRDAEEAERAAADLAERQRDAELGLTAEIEDLRIRSTQRGVERTLELLRAGYRRAVAEARAAGLEIADQLRVKFDLDARLVLQERLAGIENRIAGFGGASPGTSNPFALQSLEGTTFQEEKLVQELRTVQRLLGEIGGDVGEAERHLRDGGRLN
ncbi:MAG: phage tail tape measure protein [Planctomycetota bacterium]